MGRSQAEGFAIAVNAGEVDLTAALTYHLLSNHFPPLPTSIIPCAKAAIEAYNRGDWEAKIPLPEGIRHRVHGFEVPVVVAIEAWHLEPFLNEGHD